MLSRWASYKKLVMNLYGMQTGTSYWHAEQGLGPQFVPGRLEGYANDFSRKTRWDGAVDENGIPVCRTADGRDIIHPMMICQKALGHWDQWIEGHRTDPESLAVVLRYADWLVNAQDERGGWVTWPLVNVPAASIYSSMTQGLCMSVLSRAHDQSRRQKYLDAAVRAVDLLRTPVCEGGTARFVREGLVLEETPFKDINPVLNGWVFSLFGLYDLLLATGHAIAGETLTSTVATLVAMLPRYDAKFWSYYDLRRHLASPFYHKIHIGQLRALASAFPDYGEAFQAKADRFTSDSLSTGKCWRAILLKGIQKLADPPTDSLH